MVSINYILSENPEHPGSLLGVLKLVTSRTRVVPGCLLSELWMSSGNSEFMVCEMWKSSRYLKKHFDSAIYRRMLSALELSITKPEVRYMEFENVHGFEILKEMISKQNISEVVIQKAH